MYSKLLCLAIFVVAVSAQKFCPLEKNGNKCKSLKNQYKCSVFFEGIPGKSLKWIAALPDVLNKKKVQESSEIRASFGNLERRDFWLKSGTCTSTLGNARCYSAMLNPSGKSMDACTKTIINEDGEKTVGDVLCGRLDAKKLVPTTTSSVRNIKIIFKHSSCGASWTEIQNQGSPLRMSQDLCCNRQNGKLRYVNCDGTPVNSICNNVSA